MGLRHFWMVAAALVIALSSRWANALDVPMINGHMTDPTRTLSEADKTAIEDKLSKIQEDTRIDVAGWVVDAPEDSLDTLGNEAYRRWKIGADWDNGVFLIIPRVGRAHLIQDHAKPELNPADAARLLATDDPRAPMAQRLNRMADSVGGMLRATALHARPAGKTFPRRGLAYAGGAAGVLLLAVILTFLGRRPKVEAPAPELTPPPTSAA
jgi:hypothetical protein